MSENLEIEFEEEFQELGNSCSHLEWASVQGHLANKLSLLSFCKNDQEKIASLKGIFEECDQEKSPQDWVASCNNLASAYHSYSQYEDIAGVNFLNESLEFYKQTLMIWTRQNASTEWSSTFNNMGMLFLSLGERTHGKRSLEKSIAAFNNALTVRTKEEMPKEWAICQNNMGVSLRILAELSQNIQILKDSVECYEKALQVITKENAPVGWVMIRANLGDARIMLANQLGEKELALTAVEDFGVVAEYFSAVKLTKHYEVAINYQAKAQNIVQHISS